MVDPQRLDWTDELVDRFWDYYSRTPDVYFTAQFGHRIVATVSRYLNGNPRILDFGCGTGALTGILLRNGYRVFGADVSSDSVERVRKTYGGESGFLGAGSLGELEKSGQKFDAVFLVEVIEHLSDTHLERTFQIIRTLLVPGGSFIVTTPNAEDLEQNMVYCPNCHSVFHQMQHVRSWSATSLSDALRSHSFEVVTTGGTDFTLDPGRKLAWYLFNRFLYATGKRTPPHLFAVARRPHGV